MGAVEGGGGGSGRWGGRGRWGRQREVGTHQHSDHSQHDAPHVVLQLAVCQRAVEAVHRVPGGELPNKQMFSHGRPMRMTRKTRMQAGKWRPRKLKRTGSGTDACSTAVYSIYNTYLYSLHTECKYCCALCIL